MTGPSTKVLLALAVSLLAAEVAHAGANATSAVDVTAVRLTAPVLQLQGGTTAAVAGAPQSCVFGACTGVKDSVSLPSVGDASARVLRAGERATAVLDATAGLPVAGAVRASAQADGVTRTSTDVGARGQYDFTFLSGSTCTSATLAVDYELLQELRSQPGPERAYGDLTLALLIQNVDLGFVQDTESIRIVNDRFSGNDFQTNPSGTLSVTVPCSGIDQINARITWFAAAIAQASTPAPGQTPANPILPLPGGEPGAFTFQRTIGPSGLGVDFPLHVDPPVATGYAYAVTAGEPRFASVLVPAALPVSGDAAFRVVFPGFDPPLAAGTPFAFTDFVAAGVAAFEIRDIDPAEGLDPDDPLAFVTGLTFAGSGPVTFTMTPIVPCGNAQLDPGEECDDGGESATCDDDCTGVACGDGTRNVTAGEGCDDGNTAAGDGCDPACQVEPGCGGDAECDDGAFCNGAERCVTGDCVPGVPPDCASLDDDCHAGVCDESADACVAETTNEGGGCDDGDACTAGEVCTAGVCGGGTTAPECLPTTTSTTSTTSSTTPTTVTTSTVVPSASTSTTAMPATTTTSTTAGPATTSTSTTTSTLPEVPCDLPPFPRTGCLLEAASVHPYCGGELPEPKITRALAKGFERAATLVERAERARSARRRGSLLRAADKSLRRITRVAARVARRTPSLASCAAEIGLAVDGLRTVVGELVVLERARRAR